jgi:hypothetical protein
MPKVKKGNLQHIHIHIHTEKSKPKPKSKPKSKNLRDKSNFRNRRGKKGLSHQDIGSHIPFNAVSNPLAVQLNTLENMRLHLLPTAGHDIGEYFGARSAFGLSQPIQEQINRIDNQTKNINSRMDDAVKMYSQFKKPMPEPEEEPIPSSSTFIRGTTFDLDEDALPERSSAISPQTPALQRASSIEELKKAQEKADKLKKGLAQADAIDKLKTPQEPDDEEDEKPSKYPIPELIFTEEETKKINKNYLSEIPQKIWKKIYKELGHDLPNKPPLKTTDSARQAQYKRLIVADFRKRYGDKEKRLRDYAVIKKLAIVDD